MPTSIGGTVMIQRIGAILVACATAGIVLADDKLPPNAAKVEVKLAKEHVPDGLKAGDHVDLMFVASMTKTATGKVAYSTRGVTQNVVVTAVTEVDKPPRPEDAVKVELQVSKDQAAKIEQIKTRLVRVSERIPGGGVQTVQKPVPLRLEIAKEK
jgi:hypothetical protein